MKSRVVHESASLTAGTATALSSTIKVPAGVSKIVGVWVSSQGGGYLKMDASSLGESQYFPCGSGVTPFEGVLTPCDIPVQPMDEITLTRNAQVDTSSKYETIIVYFA